MEHKSGMVRCTEKYLVVHFTQAVGTTTRHSTVKVPLAELVNSASFLEGLERATRRALIEHWSGVEVPEEPLF